MWKVVTLYYCAVLGLSSTVSGDNENTRESRFKISLDSCISNLSIDPAGLESLKTGEVTDNKQACVLACVYKEIKLMDEHGFLWVEGSIRAAEEMFPGNAEALDRTYKYIDFCKKVNDASVSDGDQGCERAALLFKCTNEHATKFGSVL